MIQYAANILAQKLNGVLASRAGAAAKRGPGRPAGRGPSKLAGKKLDMSCRVEGCPNTSKGPRFGFMCEDHLKKLSKKEQQAARDAWKAKHA
jgi:hypothetical protein